MSSRRSACCTISTTRWQAGVRVQVEDVGLRILDMGEPHGAGLSLGKAQAGEAQIDGEHPRLLVAQPDADCVLPGAAAGNENVAAAVAERALKFARGKQTAQVTLDVSGAVPSGVLTQRG
jgi:hypothetical protein